jgi:hypothetical protein
MVSNPTVTLQRTLALVLRVPIPAATVARLKAALTRERRTKRKLLEWRRVIVATVWASVVFLWSRPLDAQKAMFRASLNVQMLWADVDYGDQRVRGQGLILAGEPMVVDIGVVNRLDGPPTAAESDWFQRITSAIYPGTRFETERSRPLPFKCVPESTRSSEVVEETNRVILDSRGGFQYVRCRVDLGEYNLAPGRYTLAVTWSDAADMNQFTVLPGVHRSPSYLTGIFEFEFRTVASEGDQLDLLNSLAAQAEAEGRHDEALRLAEQGLTRNRTNVTALFVRAKARASQGSCALSARDLQVAAEIIESGRDTHNLRYQRNEPSARRTQADEFRQSARLVRCP